jgi:hypothetical protein
MGAVVGGGEDRRDFVKLDIFIYIYNIFKKRKQVIFINLPNYFHIPRLQYIEACSLGAVKLAIAELLDQDHRPLPPPSFNVVTKDPALTSNQKQKKKNPAT